MDYKRFSKKDIVNLLEIIQCAAVCKNEEDFRKVLKLVEGMMDAEYCIGGLGKIKKSGMSDVLMVVNGDYPEEWIDMYVAEKLYEIDPVIRHHGKLLTTQLWKDTFKPYNDKKSRQFLGRAAEFGLRYGISSGAFASCAKNAEEVFTTGKRREGTGPSPAGNVSIFSFAGNTDRFNAYHKNMMNIIAPHLHTAIIRLYETFTPPGGAMRHENI